MSKSDLIQLGMLVLAVLSAVTGAIYFLYRWLRGRHFGIRFTVAAPRHERLYLAALSLRRDKPPIVERIAAWCRLSLWNVGPEARLLTEIVTRQDGDEPEALLGPLTKQVHFAFDKDTPEDPVELPLTLEPHHGVSVWALISIVVPEQLGEILFSLYGREASTLPSFRRFHGHFQEVEAFVLGGIDQRSLGIRDVSVTFHCIRLTYPLLQQRGGALEFAPRLGSFPPAVLHRVATACAERHWQLKEVLRVPARRYHVHARFAAAPTVTQHLRVDHDAMWWGRTFG